MKAIQHTASVDLAIPFIYSYRAGSEKKEDGGIVGREETGMQHIDMAKISGPFIPLDPRDVEQLAHSIGVNGLLQPIIVQAQPDAGREGTDPSYVIVAGQLRFQACKQLGWKSIPAIVRPAEHARAVPNDSSHHNA